MSEPEVPDSERVAASLSDDVTDTGVFHAVRDGYDAVYDALGRGATFDRIWRANAYGGDFPAEFAHIGFLTLTEAHRLLDGLAIGADAVLVDLACGAGGPGLWAARESGASLIGVDPSRPGLAAAERRARRTGLDQRSRFMEGTFEHTGLPAATADAVMSVDAFQYAPDKRAAIAEFRRILRPGGTLAFIAFEVDPNKAAGLPVLGVDPVADYRPRLEQAGFVVEAYEETPGWAERVNATFRAVIDAADTLTAEMGEQAAASALAEALLTVAVQPYPKRILTAARLTDASGSLPEARHRR